MKFSPQIHLTVCLALLLQLAAPAAVFARDPNYELRRKMAAESQQLKNQPTICDYLNQPEAKADPKVRTKLRKETFEKMKKELSAYTRRHRSPEIASKLKASIDAQDVFAFELEGRIVKICDYQLAAENAVIASQKPTPEGEDKKQMCHRFGELKGLYTQAGTSLNTMDANIEKELNELRNSFAEKSQANFSNLIQFETSEKQATIIPGASLGNFMGEGKEKFQGPTNTPVSAHLLLKNEATMLWGPEQPKNPKPVLASFFGQLLVPLEKEKERAKQVGTLFSQEQIKIDSIINDCKAQGNITDADLLAAEKPETPPPAVDADGDGVPDSTISENETVETTPETPNEKALRLAKEKAENEKSIAEEAAEDARIKLQQAEENAAAKANAEAEIAAAKGRKKDKNGNWVSQNKGLLLLGAGAVAVGGALWYYNSQKSDDSDSSFVGPYYRAPSSTSTSSSTSTVTLTQSTSGTGIGTVPEGSIISVDNIQTEAKVNETLQPITVQILSPTGQPIGESDTDISVTCDSGPCSLTGTLLVNTDNGRAVFDNLKFTSARSGVKLKFSAGGMVSGTTLNGVNVSE